MGHLQRLHDSGCRCCRSWCASREGEFAQRGGRMEDMNCHGASCRCAKSVSHLAPLFILRLQAADPKLTTARLSSCYLDFRIGRPADLARLPSLLPRRGGPEVPPRFSLPLPVRPPLPPGARPHCDDPSPAQLPNNLQRPRTAHQPGAPAAYGARCREAGAR